MSKPLLQYGARGESVRELQRLLRNTYGYRIDVDGVYGPDTLGAVRAFQMSEGLNVDGVVGPKTWHELYAEPAKQKKPKVDFGDADKATKAVVEAAIRDLGKAEDGNTNWSPAIAHLVDGYHEKRQTGHTKPWPWCLMAISAWIGIGLGLGTKTTDMDWDAHPFGEFFGSGYYDLLPWARKHGVLLPADGPAPLGSILIMAREGSGSDLDTGSRSTHSAMVIEDQGDKVKTIDANTSNRVRYMTRPKANDAIVGYVDWAAVLRSA